MVMVMVMAMELFPTDELVHVGKLHFGALELEIIAKWDQ